MSTAHHTAHQRAAGHHATCASLGVVTALLLAGPASAGIITLVSEVSGPGIGDVNIVDIQTPSPGNDDTMVASPNFIELTKRFDHFDYIDIEFEVFSFDGTTEYFLNETLVANESGVDWTAYRMELGFGTGAAFVQSSDTDFLDFDVSAVASSPVPTSASFATLGHGGNTLDWSNGLVPDGGFDAMTASIDVPDWNNQIPDSATFFDPGGNPIGYTFTLRQFGSVPSPASLATLALAGLIGGGRRRRA